MSSTDQKISKICKAVSIVLHPFLLPVYAVVVLLFGNTVLRNIPLNLKFYFLALISLTAFIIPALGIGVMRTVGLWGGLKDDSRQSRVIPVVVVLVCYLCCAFMIPDTAVVFLVRKFLFAAIGCLTIAAIISWWWNISLHMIACAGVVAMLMLINFASMGRLTGAICVAILLSGVVASSLLYSGKHNTSQIASGFSLGLIVASAVMLSPF